MGYTNAIMFGLGTTELVIILLIATVVFGAKRLPQLGKGLGEGIRGFRAALKGEDEETDEATAEPAIEEKTSETTTEA